MDRADIPGIRPGEQQAASGGRACGTSGSSATPTAALAPSLELRRDISRVIRQVRPQRILIQSPERNWVRIGASHPDHLASGVAAIAAIYPDARNPFAHPTLLAGEEPRPSGPSPRPG